MVLLAGLGLLQAIRVLKAIRLDNGSVLAFFLAFSRQIGLDSILSSLHNYLKHIAMHSDKQFGLVIAFALGYFHELEYFHLIILMILMSDIFHCCRPKVINNLSVLIRKPIYNKKLKPLF